VNSSPRIAKLVQNSRVFSHFHGGSLFADSALHMKRAWMAAAVLGAVLTSGTAFAQEIPVPAWSATAGAEDVVVLKDGGAVRGTVMEVLPNDHVSVKLADGRTAIIAWSVVHHIEQAAKPAASTPTPAPTPQVTPQAPAPAPVTGMVHVKMDGDDSAVLEQDHGGVWSPVCNGECDRDLPLEPMYRINGSNVRTSGSFHILGKPGDHVSLHVNTGSSSGFSLGVTMAVLGGLTGTIGIWGAYVVALSNADQYDYDYNGNQHQNSVAPWLITTAIGAAVGTVGLVMAVSNEKTKVSQASSPSEKNASLVETKTAANIPDRTPTWMNLRPAGVAAPQTATIFSVNF
jgi:hypothetical protein